jgi:hypothetical protein
MGELFDAAAMYDEDYLYFFAAPGGLSEFAVHGPVVPGAGVPGEVIRPGFVGGYDALASGRITVLPCGLARHSRIQLAGYSRTRSGVCLR